MKSSCAGDWPVEEKSVDMASECDAGLSSVGLTSVTPENVSRALQDSLGAV